MTDLGVVEPLRPPASVVAFGGRLRLLPPYAIAFLGIFVARAIADLYAVLRPLGDIGAYPTLFSLILGSVPDWLVLLVPVAVSWATVRAGQISTRITSGAIAVGLSEIVAMAAQFIGGPENPTYVISGTVRAVSFVLLAGGLLWMASGLEALRNGAPSVLVRWGAVLGVAIGAAAAITELVVRLAQMAQFDYVDYAGDEGRAILIANAVGVAYVLVPLAWAYLAWVLVRADRDAPRPRRATRLGAWAGWLTIARLGTVLVGLAWLPFASSADLEPSEGLTSLSTILLVAAIAGATFALASIAALVAGLAGGLASQQAPVPAALDDAAEPA